MTAITRFAKLLTAILVSLCAIPQIADAINKCSPSNVFATQNLGFVSQSPYTACPTGDPQASPRCTTLTFSTPGAFSIQVAFSYEPSCPEELYEVTFTGTYGYSGSVLPKYQVLSVYYAPPGAKSNALYGSSYTQSTNNAFSNTFSVANNVSVAVTDIFGISGDSVTAAYGWSESSTTSDSIAVTTTTSESLEIPGPSSSQDGIDHTQDLVYVWLNPAVSVNVVPGASVPIEVTAVNYDSTDPDQGVDAYALSVADLQVLAAGGTPPGVDMTRLARSWSPTGALTPADYQDILSADPFATNPNFNPATSNRFDSLEQTINYTPADSGGQPITSIYNSSYSTTSTAGQSATDSHSVEVAVAGTVAVSYIKLDLKAQTTWTWTNTWSSTQTSTAGQTANFTIVSPLPTDGYTGPTAIGVYKDNVYGTFMFYGEL